MPLCGSSAPFGGKVENPMGSLTEKPTDDIYSLTSFVDFTDRRSVTFKDDLGFTAPKVPVKPSKGDENRGLLSTMF